MAQTPNDEPLHRMTEAMRRGDYKALLLLQYRLRRYAGKPGVGEDVHRTSIREDSVILVVSDLLADHPRPTFRILDACCGSGTLAIHLARGLSDRAHRVAYFGVDQNPESIRLARMTDHASINLASVEYRIGEVWHLSMEWLKPVDLIVLNNSLHELPPHRFPELFEVFNKVISPEVGRVCVVDMESLPADEPESVAINWKMEEVEAILQAGGFEVALSTHPKSVAVFRVQVRHSSNIRPQAMLHQIRSFLRQKLERVVGERQKHEREFYDDDDALFQWVVLTGSIARYAVELLLVEERIEALESAFRHPPSESKS